MKRTLYILLMMLIAVLAYAQDSEPLINTGNLSRDTINSKLSSLSGVTLPQYRIKAISQLFLGIPYGSGTLKSTDGNTEHLVIDFSSVDCFTFLDYVESMRMSGNFDSFVNALRDVRYKNGDVTYTMRNHFFTDWALTGHVTDVTRLIGGEYTIEKDKTLNKIDDTRVYVPGVAPVDRKVYYIPVNGLTEKFLADKLQTGDYVGFYTDKPGLDVTHVGIIIHEGDKLILRHASSLKTNMRVVDQDFIEYLKRVKGIVVLRPVVS